MKVCFLFPGQGAQRPGMLHDLPQLQAVADTLRDVSHVLGHDALDLDSEEALRSTVNVQLAILTAGLATANALKANQVSPFAAAGLSVGAFAAAFAVGSLALTDAVELVRLRAKTMENLFPAGFGLSAIVGLTEQAVMTLVSKSSSEEHPVFVANINAPQQIVIAGSEAAMTKVRSDALQAGASKAQRLDVAVPSHCPLLKPVADTLRERIATMEIKQPQAVYIANATARPVTAASAVATDLAENIEHTVRWYESTAVAQELGTELFLEAPPGHTLTDLAKENLSGVEARPIVTRDFNYFVQLAKR